MDAVLLHERMEKPLLRLGPPDARMLREGREFLKGHLSVLEPLASSREWLAGRKLPLEYTTSSERLQGLLGISGARPAA